MADRTARRKRVHFAIDRLPWWLWPIKDAVQWVACRVFGHEPITMCPCGPSCAYCGEPSHG